MKKKRFTRFNCIISFWTDPGRRWCQLPLSPRVRHCTNDFGCVPAARAHLKQVSRVHVRRGIHVGDAFAFQDAQHVAGDGQGLEQRQDVVPGCADRRDGRDVTFMTAFGIFFCGHRHGRRCWCCIASTSARASNNGLSARACRFCRFCRLHCTHPHERRRALTERAGQPLAGPCRTPRGSSCNDPLTLVRDVFCDAFHHLHLVLSVPPNGMCVVIRLWLLPRQCSLLFLSATSVFVVDVH